MYIILHIYHRISSGKFRVSIWHEYLDGFLRENIMVLLQLFHVDVFYDNDKDRKRDQTRYQNIYKNLHFHLLHVSENFSPDEASNTADSQLSIDQAPANRPLALIFQDCTSNEQLLILRHKRSVRASVIPPKFGFDAQNLCEINQRFICKACKFIFYRPYQLICGHRLCHSCINPQNNAIHCIECDQTTEPNQIWLDRAFQNELDSITVICRDCAWKDLLKHYQEHLDEDHVQESTTCTICNERVGRNRIRNHYLSETHQRLLPNIILQAYLQRIRNQQEEKRATLLAIEGTVSELSNGVVETEKDLQQLDNDCQTHKNSIESVMSDINSAMEVAETNDQSLLRVISIHEHCSEEIISIRERLENESRISFNGTFIWKITDVLNKINDTRSERQSSIYSPVFYSSQTGYKMCLRFFLNGCNSVREEYMSIYFVLMRGKYDAILDWPFGFKVSITLFDQSISDHQGRHICEFFWPDVTSNCFLRPQLEMNGSYGIEKFISLEQFQQNLDRYARDDTMFVKVEIDFLSSRPNQKLSTDFGRMLDNDEQHVDTNDDILFRISSQ